MAAESEPGEREGMCAGRGRGWGTGPQGPPGGLGLHPEVGSWTAVAPNLTRVPAGALWWLPWGGHAVGRVCAGLVQAGDGY